MWLAGESGAVLHLGYFAFALAIDVVVVALAWEFLTSGIRRK